MQAVFQTTVRCSRCGREIEAADCLATIARDAHGYAAVVVCMDRARCNERRRWARTEKYAALPTRNAA